MTRRFLALLALALPAVAHAQQPLIDAGQQAMIQHYNDLIEQQSAPDQEEAADAARRARSSPQVKAGGTCDVDEMKAKLRPEYERRSQAEGKPAADAWLRQQGEAFGRHVRQNC